MLNHENLLTPFYGAMKPPEQFRIGAEAEKFGIIAKTVSAIPYEGEKGVLSVLEALADRYGWQRGKPEKPGGPLIALSRGGASVTLEPGAQLELSGAPLADVHAIATETDEHLAEVRAIGQEMGIVWLGVGFHPFARQGNDDLPWVPKLRYAIMKRYLPTRGDRALDMMRRTATVQANFDYSSEEDAMRKLRLALKLSPVVTAILANSPFYEGRLTGSKSERTKVWLSVDPDRQGLLPKLWHPKSKVRDYVEWALDIPMFLLKRDGEVVANTGQTFRSFMESGFQGHTATLADWELHLNTLFPEVRLKNTLEVRGADSLPARLAAALPAIWTGILYDADALARAEVLTEDWTYDEMQNLRPEGIANVALAAMFRGEPLADTAAKVIEIARGGLKRRARLSADGRDEGIHLDAIAALVEHAQCPADVLVAGLGAPGTSVRGEDVLARAAV